MHSENIPYELSRDLSVVFKKSKIRIKILLILYDFPGITDRDLIVIAGLIDKKKLNILEDLINSNVISAKQFGISRVLRINDSNQTIIDLIKFMKEKGCYVSM